MNMATRATPTGMLMVRGGRGALARWIVALAAFLMHAGFALAQVPETERVMLSGNGPDDAVLWDFSIDSGMGAGKDARIAVPSNWQQQGFGHYQYGYDRGPRSNDHAVYRRSFDVPVAWKGRTIRIVFDGVMTDALVEVNGIVAGAAHQGGFSQFGYDITSLIKPGERNSLEVQVSEASAAKDTDIAERWGDYWALSGIYRPVWLEATPAEAIGKVAIDARANGDIMADVTLAAPRTADRVIAQVRTRAGEAVGGPFTVMLPSGGTGSIRVAGHIDAPALWSAETPNLYQLDMTLRRGDEALHHLSTRFGFRTFEVREGQGLYLNGQRILLKGVNRHSFRADTGRALTREDAYADVRTLRDLNMNAVRMSHYAPEQAFLEAADELGLYVIDELSGWQHAHDTEVGRKLVRELVERDRNHPSVVIWTNGNEGGWNRALDGDFAFYDPQKRPVLHPWELFGGIDTKHYPRYDDLLKRLSGPSLVMPTEVLHALFDGGGGTGLDDYWRAISQSPRGAGAFLWNFADEGIARRDQNGRIDMAATLAPDGIVGARHEKEPSYYTIRDVWSPIQIEAPKLDATFDGLLKLANSYDFTTLAELRFEWRWLKFAGASDHGSAARTLAQGKIAGPAIAPHENGVMALPVARAPNGADALALTAWRGDAQVSSWTWPVALMAEAALPVRRLGTPSVERDGGVLRLRAGKLSVRFDPVTGLLSELRQSNAMTSLQNGPKLVFARPEVAAPVWTEAMATPGDIWRPASAGMANIAEIETGMVAEDGWAGFTLQVSPDGVRWTTVFSGARTARDGKLYPFAPQRVAAVRIIDRNGVRAVPQIRTVKLGYQRDRFPDAPDRAPVITTGIGRDAVTGRPTAWLEAPGAGGLQRARWTLSEDGTLALDYAYKLEGPALYHGVGFDNPGASTATGLLRGPWPVWQNRMRGPQLGVHQIAPSGYFADPHWLRLAGAGGSLVARNAGQVPFLQFGTRIADLPSTSVDFPHADIGFLAAIPAMGAKFQVATTTGPAGAPSVATGQYQGQLLFNLLPGKAK